MRIFLSVITIVVACALAAGASRSVAAADDLPATFGECVARGGTVRQVDGDITCRFIENYDFRVYGSGTTECGERIDLEIWGETRAGVMTYFLQPTEAVELPEVGTEGMALPEGPIPCLDENGS